MLQSIHVKNLQTHRDTLLELHPGVNIIIGRSRSGKTAIFRAVRKVLENRPIQGIERWVHKHKPKTSIEIEIKTTDGHEVSWIGPKEQRYMVDGQELTGFGQGVPELVAQTLNLGDINMADQHDRPFLLFDSPGEVARVLNRVVHLDSIDTALANITGLKRQNDQELRVQEVRIAELQEQEAGFPDLVAAEEYVAMLEGQEAELADKSDKIQGLRAIQEQLGVLRSGLKQAQVPGTVLIALDNLLARQTEWEQKVYTAQMLRGRQADLQELRTSLAVLGPVLGQDAWVSEMLTKNNHLGAKRRHLTRITSLNEQIAHLRTQVEARQSIIKQEEQEFRKLLPEKCTECPLFT